MGVSVKWADIYPSTIAYQWIDVTEVPDGTYRLKGEDPDRRPPGQDPVAERQALDPNG